MFLRCHCNNLDRQHARPSQNHFPWVQHYGHWCNAAVLIFRLTPVHCRPTDYWVGRIASQGPVDVFNSAISLTMSSQTLQHRANLDDRFGNGLNTSTVPTWQSECSKSHRRGQLVMVEVFKLLLTRRLSPDHLQGALITGGVMLSYWLDFGFSFLDPNPVAWRFPIAFQIVFALVIMAFILELPESPRWLILKGS